MTRHWTDDAFPEGVDFFEPSSYFHRDGVHIVRDGRGIVRIGVDGDDGEIVWIYDRDAPRWKRLLRRLAR